ncbi:hypothetical protein ACP4OV_024134 [Aristida adscensionis]
MDMDDEEDIWANTTSPSASPPSAARPAAGGAAFISTQLSLNSRLHLLSSTAAPPDDIFRNAAATPAPFFPYDLPGARAVAAAPLDAGAARAALEHEMCGGGGDRRSKRMIKNRESAARSRARKQAYVRQLEREVELLQQENKSLRLKYEQGVRGGAGAGEEDAEEDAVRAILMTTAAAAAAVARRGEARRSEPKIDAVWFLRW